MLANNPWSRYHTYTGEESSSSTDHQDVIMIEAIEDTSASRYEYLADLREIQFCTTTL